MTAPQAVIDIGFSSPEIGNVFTIGDSIKGEVNLYPIAGDVWAPIDTATYVRSWRTRYGAGRGDEQELRYDAATATIELNDGDRRFDPENLAGPYVSAGRSNIEPMRRVRIRLVWDGVSYPVFYGYSDDFQPEYIGNDHTVTTLTATDGQKVLGGIGRIALTPAGAGEDSGARVERILDSVGWTGPRLISTGDTTVQETDLGGNALAELQLVQDTELGEFYMDRAGWAVFRNRQAMVSDTRSNTPQAVFGDGGLTATGEIPYADVLLSTGASTMANRVSITRVDGVAQVVEDSSSVSRYLPKTYERADLIMQTDDVALAYADAILYQYGTPRRRFSRIEFNTARPGEDATVWPALLAREVGDRVTIRRRPAGGGDPIAQDCFIRGIELAQNEANELKVAFILQAASRYSFFVINDPILGRVGENAIAY